MDSGEISKEERSIHPSKDKPSDFFLRSSADLAFVAQYLNRDPDLWVFRRFGKLHLFNILCLQQRLAELENTLEEKIWKDETTGFESLLYDIKIAIKEYDDALSAQAKYRSYRQPEKRVWSLFEKWWNFYNGRGSALRIGLDFHTGGKKRAKDLAAIAVLEKTWTHRFIDGNDRLRRIFAKDDDVDEQLPTTLLYSEDNVRRAEAVFLHACFCFLLLCPIFALSYVDNETVKLAIVVVFLFAASVLTAGFLNVPNKNALALVAGYSAILVVFLGNNVGCTSSC